MIEALVYLVAVSVVGHIAIVVAFGLAQVIRRWA
jgi:hypothetical protein